MKILYILESYWPNVGGAETLMAQLCTGIARRKHDVTVLTRSLPGAPNEEIRDGVRIVRVSAPGGRFTFPITALFKALKLASDADVIHTSTFSAAPLASLVSLLVRRPVVLTVHELWVGKWRTFSDAPIINCAIFDLLERLIFKLHYDAYVGVSEFTSNRLRTYLRRRHAAVRTIYNGFDPVPWEAAPEHFENERSGSAGARDFKIVAYGRPGISKGFRYLIDAFPGIASVVPNARLHLILSDTAATGRDLAKLKNRADPRIVFESSLPFEKLAKAVRSADCVVVPSLAEGFGYTALEAAASGIPVVASDTTSIPEVIGGRYQLSKPRDVPSIVRAVAQVARGDVLERDVPKFDWSVTIGKYEQVYQTVARPQSSEISATVLSNGVEP